MLDIITVGANYSPLAYQDRETGEQVTRPAFAAEFVEHRFSTSDAGELLHYIDGVLRATVPPEGWEDYAATWPACADLIRQLER